MILPDHSAIRVKHVRVAATDPGIYYIRALPAWRAGLGGGSCPRRSSWTPSRRHDALGIGPRRTYALPRWAARGAESSLYRAPLAGSFGRAAEGARPHSPPFAWQRDGPGAADRR